MYPRSPVLLYSLPRVRTPCDCVPCVVFVCFVKTKCSHLVSLIACIFVYSGNVCQSKTVTCQPAVSLLTNHLTPHQ